MANSVSHTGSPILADTRGLSRLARNLRQASPETWKACRVALRVAVQPVAADAQSRASYSTRIPQTVKVRVTGGGNVKIVAGGVNAPDAAPLENKGQPGTFRHPVFGNREVWVDQPARPFLGPAVEAHKVEVAAKLEAAVTEAIESALRGV
jgi:hypothetical protein